MNRSSPLQLFTLTAHDDWNVESPWSPWYALTEHEPPLPPSPPPLMDEKSKNVLIVASSCAFLRVAATLTDIWAPGLINVSPLTRGCAEPPFCLLQSVVNWGCPRASDMNDQ